MRTMESNVKSFNIYIFLNRLELWLPIYILFLMSKGFSLTQIAVLDAVWYISTFIFEVPTGAVTDRYGKKISMLISVLCQSISFFVLAFSNSFVFISVSYAVWGFASAFETGTYSAFLYDSLKQINKEDDYRKVIGRVTTLTILASALGSIMAGYLGGISLALPILITASIALLLCPMVLLFVEPEVQDTREPTYYIHIKESMTFILKHRVVALLLLYQTIIGTAVWALQIFYQPLLNSFGIAVENIGICYFIFKLCSAGGAHFSDSIYKILDGKSLYVIPAFFVGSVLCLGLLVDPLVIGFILCIFFISGFYSPILNSLLNQNLPSGKRATIISFGSILGCVTLSIVNPLLGKIADTYSLQTTFQVLGLGTLFFLVLILIFLKKEAI
ncbi:MAG: MFS transporter [Theionarchaea archaeon]|nr:MFS transporter [Theionarchaea archaeon]